MREGLASTRWLIAAAGLFLTGWPVLTGRAAAFDPGVLLTFLATWTGLVALVVWTAPREHGPVRVRHED